MGYKKMNSEGCERETLISTEFSRVRPLSDLELGRREDCGVTDRLCGGIQIEFGRGGHALPDRGELCNTAQRLRTSYCYVLVCI